MPISNWQIEPPIITVLGGALRRSRSRLHISSNSYIQITADSPDYRIYFTTDESEPDPFQKSARNLNQTYRYRGPFTLKPGSYRTVSAVSVSGSGERSCVTSKDFDIADDNVDESSTGLSAMSQDGSMFDDNTYTLESTCSPGTTATLSEVYFSPHGRVYSRGRKKEAELDRYFEQSELRWRGHDIEPQYAWQDGCSSEGSDAETEVTNYFRASRSHQPSQSEHRNADWYNVGHCKAPDPSSSRSGRRVGFVTQPFHDFSVSAYSRRAPENYSQSMPFPAPERAHSPLMLPGGRRTPLADAGYDMGQRYAAGCNQPQPTLTSGFRPIRFQEHTTNMDPFRSVNQSSANCKEDAIKQGHARNEDLRTEKILDSSPDESVVVHEVQTKEKNALKAEEKKKTKDHKVKKKNSEGSSSSGSSSESEIKIKKKKKKTKSDKNEAKKSDKQISVKKHDFSATKHRILNTDTPRIEKPGKKSDSGMHFINDSGTQINFWGTKPEEILQQIAAQNLPQSLQCESTPSAITSTGTQSSMSKKPSVTKPMQSQAVAGALQTGDSNRVATSESEQKSFASAFRDFFGFGKGKKRSKKKTNRSTGQWSLDAAGEGYEQIRAQCLEERTLWEDPQFPAVDAALYFENKPEVWPVEWKRPHEICSDPQMFVAGASRFDVKQGILGNCWLLAAVASLSSNEGLIKQVVPPGQSFKREYAGIFRFRFWQYGEWQEVCIDDRLPTKNNQLIYMHSIDSNEFWSPLLEKAYAKLSLCYESLSGGQTSDAMTDFTGGCVEKFNFREELPSSMYSILLKAQERQSLMGCSIDSSGTTLEEELPNGLIMGHAYTITDVKMVTTGRGSEQLVRVRNPWGNECEWKGAWRDGSKEWNSLSNSIKKELGITFEHDGEFWMSFRDFSTHFQRVEICNLQPDCMADAAHGEGARSWNTSIQHSEWKKRVSAGGCRNYPRTFWTNPQFNIRITDIDEDDEEEVGTIIVGLMQCGRRQLRKLGQDNLTIGYEIYSAGERHCSGTLSEDYLRRARTVASCASYINSREVCGRHRLPPGHYTIIPSTFEPNEEATFVMRIFSEKENRMAALDERTCHVQIQQLVPVNAAAGSRQRNEAEAEFQRHGGDDMLIDAYELQDILNGVFIKDFEFAGFDLNLCRSMIAMTDSDMTGKLEFDEFQELWQFLQDCKVTYRKFDKDQSGCFNSYELREALKSVGYTLSNEAFSASVMRFSDRDGNVKFDDFIACVVKLKPTFDTFHEMGGKNEATFTLEDLVQLTLHA